MELHVRRGSVEGMYEARFRFRVLGGVMILFADREMLVQHFNIRERARMKDSYWYWDYMEESSRWFNDKTSPVIETTASNKRKPCDGEEQPGVSAKKRKGAINTAPAPHPRRFWSIWQGRETGEGQWQTDYHNSHTGCLEFADDKFTAFQGQVNLEFVGGDDLVYGRTLSDAPSTKSNMDSAWSKFS